MSREKIVWLVLSLMFFFIFILDVIANANIIAKVIALIGTVVNLYYFQK